LARASTRSLPASERGRAALAEAQSQAADLARAPAERDAQIAALTAALARLEEQRAALAEAKERALTLALERRELAQEGRRLRAQLRECTERLEPEKSQSDSETQ
jgi:chromosome segregation ATPase